MGRGEAKKRRIKNAVAANFGNLHKAMKGKASARMPLAAAPAKNQQEKLPASLRRMMALQEATAKQSARAEAAKAARQLQRAAAEDAEQPAAEEDCNGAVPAGEASVSDAEEPQQQTTQQPAQPQRQQAAGEAAAGTSGRPGDKAASGAAAQPKLQHGSGLADKLPAFEAPPKPLKARKKEYLKKKQDKKRKRGGNREDDEGDLEAALRARDRGPKFGEQADAPLQMHLKRKHWTDAQLQDKTANERCKAIFLKQLDDAKKRAAGVSGAGFDHGLSTGGLPVKKPQLRVGEREELRAQAIAAYRSQKKANAGDDYGGGGATLSSLAKLVKSQSGRATDYYQIS